MSRWLLVLGGLVVALLVALVVLVRGDPKVATIDGGVVPRAIDAIALEVPDAAIVIDARVADASASIAPRDERESLLAGMRDSGSGAESWVTQGLGLLTSFAGGGVAIRDASCYVAGCSATFTFPSEREYQRRRAELEASEAYRAWTGGKRVSSPELRPDGQLVIALLLYRPD